MQDLQQQLGLSYLFIAHDLGVVRHMADRVAVMYLGRIIETAPKRTLYTHPAHPYTQALLRAVPLPDPARRSAPLPLAGEIPSPAAPPPGCTFHTRCPMAQARCRAETPVLRPVGAQHAAACHFVHA